MRNLRYKGYNGSVEYYEDETGNYFYGTVQGLRHATVSFEGDTIEELKVDFEAGVDDYLDYCKEYNVEPEKPFITQMKIRLSPDLHSRVASVAKANGESINAFITRIARREVENASV